MGKRSSYQRNEPSNRTVSITTNLICRKCSSESDQLSTPSVKKRPNRQVGGCKVVRREDKVIWPSPNALEQTITGARFDSSGPRNTNTCGIGTSQNSGTLRSCMAQRSGCSTSQETLSNSAANRSQCQQQQGCAVQRSESSAATTSQSNLGCNTQCSQRQSSALNSQRSSATSRLQNRQQSPSSIRCTSYEPTTASQATPKSSICNYSREQPTRDDCAPCKPTNNAPDRSTFKVKPLGCTQCDALSKLSFPPQEPEAICIPCGQTFTETDQDTCWRVKIMKDVGSAAKSAELGNIVQTQTSETRIINDKKLEELLPESEREGDSSNLEPCSPCKCNDRLEESEDGAGTSIKPGGESGGHICSGGYPGNSGHIHIGPSSSNVGHGGNGSSNNGGHLIPGCGESGVCSEKPGGFPDSEGRPPCGPDSTPSTGSSKYPNCCSNQPSHGTKSSETLEPSIHTVRSESCRSMSSVSSGRSKKGKSKSPLCRTCARIFGCSSNPRDDVWSIKNASRRSKRSSSSRRSKRSSSSRRRKRGSSSRRSERGSSSFISQENDGWSEVYPSSLGKTSMASSNTALSETTYRSSMKSKSKGKGSLSSKKTAGSRKDHSSIKSKSSHKKKSSLSSYSNVSESGQGNRSLPASYGGDCSGFGESSQGKRSLPASYEGDYSGLGESSQGKRSLPASYGGDYPGVGESSQGKSSLPGSHGRDYSEQLSNRSRSGMCKTCLTCNLSKMTDAQGRDQWDTTSNMSACIDCDACSGSTDQQEQLHPDNRSISSRSNRSCASRRTTDSRMGDRSTGNSRQSDRLSTISEGSEGDVRSVMSSRHTRSAVEPVYTPVAVSNLSQSTPRSSMKSRNRKHPQFDRWGNPKNHDGTSLSSRKTALSQNASYDGTALSKRSVSETSQQFDKRSVVTYSEEPDYYSISTSGGSQRSQSKPPNKCARIFGCGKKKQQADNLSWRSGSTKSQDFDDWSVVTDVRSQESLDASALASIRASDVQEPEYSSKAVSELSHQRTTSYPGSRSAQSNQSKNLSPSACPECGNLCDSSCPALYAASIRNDPSQGTSPTFLASGRTADTGIEDGHLSAGSGGYNPSIRSGASQGTRPTSLMSGRTTDSGIEDGHLSAGSGGYNPSIRSGASQGTRPTFMMSGRTTDSGIEDGNLGAGSDSYNPSIRNGARPTSLASGRTTDSGIEDGNLGAGSDGYNPSIRNGARPTSLASGRTTDSGIEDSYLGVGSGGYNPSVRSGASQGTRPTSLTSQRTAESGFGRGSNKSDEICPICQRSPLSPGETSVSQFGRGIATSDEFGNPLGDDRFSGKSRGGQDHDRFSGVTGTTQSTGSLGSRRTRDGQDGDRLSGTTGTSQGMGSLGSRRTRDGQDGGQLSGITGASQGMGSLGSRRTRNGQDDDRLSGITGASQGMGSLGSRRTRDGQDDARWSDNTQRSLGRGPLKYGKVSEPGDDRLSGITGTSQGMGSLGSRRRDGQDGLSSTTGASQGRASLRSGRTGDEQDGDRWSRGYLMYGRMGEVQEPAYTSAYVSELNQERRSIYETSQSEPRSIVTTAESIRSEKSPRPSCKKCAVLYDCKQEPVYVPVAVTELGQAKEVMQEAHTLDQNSMATDIRSTTTDQRRASDQSVGMTSYGRSQYDRWTLGSEKTLESRWGLLEDDCEGWCQDRDNEYAELYSRMPRDGNYYNDRYEPSRRSSLDSRNTGYSSAVSWDLDSRKSKRSSPATRRRKSSSVSRSRDTRHSSPASWDAGSLASGNTRRSSLTSTGTGYSSLASRDSRASSLGSKHEKKPCTIL